MYTQTKIHTLINKRRYFSHLPEISDHLAGGGIGQRRLVWDCLTRKSDNWIPDHTDTSAMLATNAQIAGTKRGLQKWLIAVGL